MATVTLPTRRRNYLNTNYGILSWLLTTDHKRIAMLYLMVILVFFIVGGAAAGMIRLELLTPEANIVTPDDYNKIFTAHGVVMIFFFLLPAIPAIL
ncbi:MAG: cbb3-type cytochrome c oxidase subunit I, partial [Anaerolineae bacterium]|nr:cbb3-type cytochrome c oxidase subunit I [Anaerolineae bacterium]